MAKIFNRRNLLIGGTTALAGGFLYLNSGSSALLSDKDIAGRIPLKMPPLMDAAATGKFQLTAQSGETEFFSGAKTATIGFNQSYLGPVVRVRQGGVQPTVNNQLSWPISSHWHGLVIPGDHDGGPHQGIEAGQSWSVDTEISQQPTTAFFHTHMHGTTGRDVYHGLAGILHVTDDQDNARGLPTSYGVDDLTLVLQDRRFSQGGQLEYNTAMGDVMHGMTGDHVLINGQIDPVAVVPRSVVRLRLVNASNARIFSLSMSDDRPMHLIATDGGYLPHPTPLERLRLSPGERAEILIDFSDGNSVTLISDGDPNSGMGAMMGRARAILDRATGMREFSVIPFVVDDRLERTIDKIPDQLDGSFADLANQDIVRTREFSLDMGMGGMMNGGGFAINGRAFRHNVINEKVRLGSVEKWIVRTSMLAHPFHIHGVLFQVLSENGKAALPESRGWKDTVVVDGETELLVKFTQPASEQSPYMYHCHILEHEDAGMMGQFTVS